MRIKDFDTEQKKIIQTIQGTFTNTKKDAHGEKLTLEALKKAKDDSLKYPYVFYEHDTTKPPVGIITHMEIRKIEENDYELYGEVGIFDEKFMQLIEQGKVNCFSISFITGENKNE